MTPNRADGLARLARLERRYDGPVPAEELPGGSARRLAEGAHALHQRLAAAAREAAARRRRRLSALSSAADSWLSRLALALAGHRRAALAVLTANYRN